MFFEKYIKDPLQYAWSDPKKIFVGGVFQLISIGGIVLGLAVMFASVMSAIGVPEFGSLPQLTFFSGLVGIFLGVIIATIGVVFTAFIYGYYMRVIENTLV